jgi:hypothetical protein
MIGFGEGGGRRNGEGWDIGIFPGAKEILFCSQFVWYLDVLGSVAL